jgi:hypothetical protein
MPVDSLLALIAFLALVLTWVALPGSGQGAPEMAAAPVPAGVVPA